MSDARRLRVAVPPGLDSQRSLGREWARWLDGLPRLAAEVLEEWELEPDGDSMYGFCSLVLPVRDAEGRAAVLKLHSDVDAEESDHEHLALQHWGGKGAVRLLRADPSRRALLLERLHQRNLNELWDLEACEVVAALYSRIHIPALPQLRPQTLYVERWTDDLARLPRGAPLPRRLVEQAIALGRGFVTDPASTGTMIHGDLHYENVLASDREPWLVIDPKPTSGDPHYEVAALLWNRWDELVGDIRGGVRRRFLATVDAAGFDEDRARDWVIVRMMHNAMWELEDHPDTPDADYLTMCVAIAKAVQD